MKKIFSRLVMLMLTFVAASMAAQAQMTDPLPLDPQVRSGVLPNGLHYYIRHNEMPKGQADFYIAQKVGSILENDQQRGLAHFLEHMCFNGTENFPGNELVSWLETKGVKFGQNLNAYTAIDETVYNIANVPTASEAVQDSVLLILHDWADGLLLLPEEIDKERGVIHQEWRSRNVGQQRLMEQMAPAMYPGSKYGYRLPIGTMEVVDNFPPQVLRDYYETWYRPDQQGVVVVGDIDVDRIEAKIKEFFSPIEMPAGAPERVYEEVPDTPGTIYAIGADTEMPNTRVTIYFKDDVVPRELRNTLQGMVADYVQDMMVAMFNARLDEIASDPDAPFAGAGSYYGQYFLASTKDAMTVVGIAKEDVIPTLKSIYREWLRAQRGGFTVSEYDRARDEYLSRLEKAYNNREKTETNTYVQKLVRHFIDNTPATDIETKYQIMNMLAPNIPVEAINMGLAQMDVNNNRVVTVMMPEKEGLTVPTEADLAAAIAEVDAEDIAPFVDEVKSEPLIPALPAPGKVVSTKELDKWGATEWTLSNGAKVVVKKTDFNADEIRFDAQAKGGYSGFGDDYAASIVFLGQGSLGQYGLGTYTFKDMQKYLQGKQIDFNIEADTYLRDISGETTPKDLPYFMEMLYSIFTQFNMSADEFQATKNTFKGFLHNQETNPQYIFGTKLTSTLFASPKRQSLSSQIVDDADYAQTMQIVKDLTANAADYTFYFVGNFDIDQLRTLCEQYIATLPAGTDPMANTIVMDPTLELRKDAEKINTFTTAMQTPQTYVAIVEHAAMPYTAKDVLLADIFGQILTERLTNTVREDMGAVYSIWANGRMSRMSQENVVLQSVFPMKPEMKDEVVDLILKEILSMEGNITEKELAKVKEFETKDAIENLEKNQAWLNGMAGEAINGVDTFNGRQELIASITVADLQDFIARFNALATTTVVILDPEATE